MPLPERPDAVGGAGGLPDPQVVLRAGLRADRPHHVRQPGHGVAAPADRRPVHRRQAEAVFAGDRHGVHARRPAAAVDGAVLRDGARGRGVRRHRVLDLPPGIIPRRPHGLGGPARVRAVVLPGGRERGLGVGAAAGGVHRAAARARQHRLVLPDRARRHRHPGARGGLVQAPPAVATSRPTKKPAAAAVPGRERAAVAGDPRRARLLEEHLSGQPDQLLHVLPDSEVRAVGAERAAAPVRPARGGGGRHVHRRAGRRPHRPQVRDLGVDPRRAAVHAGAALREPALDGGAERRHRAGAGVGVLGHRGVRAGTRAGRVGTISGIFFGFAFGAGAIGAALLGQLADATSIDLVYKLCSYLPAIGLLTVFLPDIEPARSDAAAGDLQTGVAAPRPLLDLEGPARAPGFG